MVFVGIKGQELVNYDFDLKLSDARKVWILMTAWRASESAWLVFVNEFDLMWLSNRSHAIVGECFCAVCKKTSLCLLKINRVANRRVKSRLCNFKYDHRQGIAFKRFNLAGLFAIYLGNFSFPLVTIRQQLQPLFTITNTLHWKIRMVCPPYTLAKNAFPPPKTTK